MIETYLCTEIRKLIVNVFAFKFFSVQYLLLTTFYCIKFSCKLFLNCTSFCICFKAVLVTFSLLSSGIFIYRLISTGEDPLCENPYNKTFIIYIIVIMIKYF